jgi:hypothetical protein
MKKKIFIAIVAIIGTTMLFACSQKKTEQGKEKATQANETELVAATTEASKTISISPVTILSYGSSYTINSYEIYKDETGQTIVEAIGYGFGTLKFVDGQMIIPVWGAAIFNGQKYDAYSASASTKSVVYYFKTSEDPETIIFYPVDNEDKAVEISCM